jgi:hypothetical protein
LPSLNMRWVFKNTPASSQPSLHALRGRLSHTPNSPSSPAASEKNRSKNFQTAKKCEGSVSTHDPTRPKEASAPGNMKFSMNGALNNWRTIGRQFQTVSSRFFCVRDEWPATAVAISPAACRDQRVRLGLRCGSSLLGLFRIAWPVRCYSEI